MRATSVVCGALAVWAPWMAAAHAADAPRALLLGNSYVQFNDLDQRLQELVRTSAPPLDSVAGERLADGGLTLNDHLGRTRTASDANPWWSRFGATTVPAQWVVFQDQSQVPGFPEDHPYWIASAAAVAPLADLAVASGAVPFLLVTWGRRDGDSGNPERYPDFSTMNALLEAGYLRYAALASTPERPIFVVPVNRAFAAIHDDIVAAGGDPLAPDSAFFALYDGDGSHPSRLGSALAAAVLTRALTGWSPRWLRPPPGLDVDEVEPFVDVADGVIVPDGDLQWPWAGAWESDAVDGLGPDTGRLVSHPQWMWTEVVGSGSTRVDVLALGGVHAAADASTTSGGGRLWVPSGAEFAASRLELGQNDGGVGELVVAGGSTAVDTVQVQATRGRVQVRAGSVVLQRVTVSASDADGPFLAELELRGGALTLGAAPNLVQMGGLLRAATASVALDRLDVRGGSLLVDRSDVVVTVGRWMGEGTWVVELSDSDACASDRLPQVLVSAGVCDVDALLVVPPAGCDVAIEPSDAGGCSLILQAAAAIDSGTADAGDGTDAAPTDGSADAQGDDAGDGGDASPDTADAGLSIVKNGDAGCGCGGGPPQAGVLALLCAAAAAARRRSA